MNWTGVRIAVVGPLPPPFGGIANQTRQLAELLRGEGAEVELVQSNRAYSPEWVSGVRVVRAIFRLVPYLVRLWRAAGRADLLHVMANSGRSWHLFAVPAIWIAKLRRVPAVVNYRGGEAESFLARSAPIVRATLAQASALAVPSRFLHEIFMRHGVPSEIVPNIIDSSRFRPAEVTADRPRQPHVVIARNLEAIYDISTGLRAFRQVVLAMPDARLTVAGSGPERSTLEALARELGISHAVRFPGQIDRDAMAELYRSATVALNPARIDNMPNFVLEALASGLPVISTRVGGVPYIVKDGVTALLVDAGDAEAMAAAVIRVIRDGDLAATLVAAGLEEVRAYVWSNVRDRWAAVYQAALEGRRLAAGIA